MRPRGPMSKFELKSSSRSRTPCQGSGSRAREDHLGAISHSQTLRPEPRVPAKELAKSGTRDEDGEI